MRTGLHVSRGWHKAGEKNLWNQDQRNHHHGLEDRFRERGNSQPDSNGRARRKDQGEKLPSHIASNSPGAKLHYAVKKHALNNRDSGEREKFRQQIAVSTEADQALPAKHRKFFHDLLGRVSTPEPKRGNIGKKKHQGGLLADPRHQQADKNGLPQHQQDIFPVGAKDRPLAAQQNRQSRAPLASLRKRPRGFLKRGLFPMRDPFGSWAARETVIKKRQALDVEIFERGCGLSEKYQTPVVHDRQPVKQEGIAHDMS